MISVFESKKQYYMTRAVAEELPDEHKRFILQYLHEKQQYLTDYLQIFEFYIENGQQ
ncbi:hypothetical protein [Lysinibacillus antri]|uniref:hypothetical protein n=1 Tax=Lysinibacillus antri TaxID=2498145 RepID=UPI00131A42FC|nr:hypothetical protein [Lysinibacillus antri]